MATSSVPLSCPIGGLLHAPCKQHRRHGASWRPAVQFVNDRSTMAATRKPSSVPVARSIRQACALPTIKERQAAPADTDRIQEGPACSGSPVNWTDHVSIAVLAAAATLCAHAPGAAWAEGLPAADVLGRFQISCAGCHAAGGNVVQPGATLFMKDLSRNGADSEEAIYDIIYAGKNKMPGYGANCKPRGQCTFGPRLTDDEIRALSRFVLKQAEEGWPR